MGLKDEFASWGGHSSGTASSTTNVAPECKFAGCTGRCGKKKRALGYEFCKKHKRKENRQADDKSSDPLSEGTGTSASNATESAARASTANTKQRRG